MKKTIKSSNGNNFFSACLCRMRARHARHYRDNYFHLWADLLLAGMLAGLVFMIIWLMIWQPRADFSLKTRLAEAHVTSGHSQTFIIDYQNGEASAVSGASIALKLPAHFVVQSASPAELYDVAAARFKIGDVPKGEEGEVSITGIIIGEPGQRQALELSAMYQSAQVKKSLLDTFSYTIDDSSLEMNLKLPERAYREADFRGSLEIKNTSDTPIKGVELAFPSKDLEISLEDGDSLNSIIKIDKIAVGETKTINLIGSGKTIGNFDLKAEASLRVNQDLIQQTSIAKRISIAEPNLKIRASLRDKNLAAVAPTTQLNISFENLEKSEITNLTFTVLPARSGVTVAAVTAVNSLTVRGATISYNHSLAAAAIGTLSALVVLERDRVQMNDSAGVSVGVTYQLAGQKYEYVVSAGSVNFNSNLNLSSGGYYYGPQGDQLGVGPIPPRVDIPTTYWIIWQVNNLGNDVKDMQVTADLPETIAWTDQKSLTAGSIEYSPVNRRILWRPGDITKGGGNYRASFAVSLVPRTKDIGKVLDLLSHIHFKATDSFTGASLERNLPGITTNVEADKLSAGKGTVLPLE